MVKLGAVHIEGAVYEHERQLFKHVLTKSDSSDCPEIILMRAIIKTKNLMEFNMIRDL